MRGNTDIRNDGLAAALWIPKCGRTELKST